MALGDDTVAALAAAGVMFLWALGLGMRTSDIMTADSGEIAKSGYVELRIARDVGDVP